MNILVTGKNPSLKFTNKTAEMHAVVKNNFSIGEKWKRA